MMRPGRRLHELAEARLSRVDALLVAAEEGLATTAERRCVLERAGRASASLHQALWILEEGQGRFLADAKCLVGEAAELAVLLEAEVTVLRDAALAKRVEDAARLAKP